MDKFKAWFVRNRWWLGIILIVLLVLTTVFLGLFVFDPHIFFHYIVEDLYENMWSNMFAPSMITLAAVLVSYIRGKIHREKLHKEQMKQHSDHHEEIKAAITEGVSNG